MARLTIEKNNNPGALRIPGSTEFQRFSTPEEGIRAQEDLLRRRYFGKGLNSVSRIIETYAPRKSRGGDNTDEQVNNYISYVANRLGVNPNDSLSPNLVPKLASVIREFETGKGKKAVPSRARAEKFADGIMAGLGVPKEYTVAEPTEGEVANIQAGGNFPVANASQADAESLRSTAGRAVNASGRYADFLENAIAPLQENAQAVVAEREGIAATKHSLANDVKTRADDLRAKIAPLQEQRQNLLNRMAELDQLSPLERRFKATFSSDWDPRVLRGRLERVDNQITGYETTWNELNEIHSTVVGLSVDAEQADIDVLNTKASDILAQAQLYGQAASAIRTNADTALLPFEMQHRLLTLQESQKRSLLGKMSLEMLVSLESQATESPDGSVEVDGVKLTLGELQDASRVTKQQDLTLRSMANSIKLQDIETAERLEDNLIENMTAEQIEEALANGGMYRGQQLSVAKLATAAQTADALRTQQVDEIILSTAVGQASAITKQSAEYIRGIKQRATEMFGNLPGELAALDNVIAADVNLWVKQFEEARSQGVEREFIARTADRMNSWQTRFDAAVTEIAKKWGGGKSALTAVAENYLRGNPLSGDAALDGLIIVAESGMPAGSKLSGPAQAAMQAARAEIQAFRRGPDMRAGDSLEALLAGNQGSKKEELRQRVRQAVETVYAESITNELFGQLPSIAAKMNHPFKQVTAENFKEAVHHGDNEGFERVGRDLGLNPQQTRQLFAQGPGGPIWQAVKKAKGFNDDQYDDLLQNLQATQMTGLLQALDARQKGAAREFVALMQTPQVLNHVDQLVNSYGRSSFGAFLVSSSAGGGYRESWSTYAEGLAATHSALNSTELREMIKQQRGLLGDPKRRFAAVLGAAGLTKQESAILIDATLPMIGMQENGLAGADPRLNRTLGVNTQTFDTITNVIQSHRFEDPQVERIRQKAAKRWDEMNSVMDAIQDSVR